MILIKLGGSLLTDKSQPESLREERVRRLAGELADVARTHRGRVILGHGSGSFGHVAAERWKVHEGVGAAPDGSDALEGIARTQHLAARLHRRIVSELLAAGGRPYSFVPSSAVTSRAGTLGPLSIEPLLAALAIGLLPVTYGDVVMDREQGGAIASTEAVFEALAGALVMAGQRVDLCLWLGETPGILDTEGEPIPLVSVGDGSRALAAAGGSAGTDVTGGMRLRLETALRLAEQGIESLILDGRKPGALARALEIGAGELGAKGTESSLHGTRVCR